jgi:cob(I)alamin adenosyltransferase
VYTRRGDRGETSLFGERRVPKDSPRVEAYGTIDELNSVLGVAASGSPTKLAPSLREVQALLFVAGADCASDLGKAGVPRISEADVKWVEGLTDSLLASLPPLRNFIIPGGSRLGAELQLARAVCRRAERRILEASRTEKLNPELLPFFNRLSTLLFDLSRVANREARKKEVVWKGRSVQVH